MIKYNLVGIDGNAFSVMGYVSQAMRREHKPQWEIDAYIAAAMSGNYNNLLCVSMDVIDNLNEKYKEIEDPNGEVTMSEEEYRKIMALVDQARMIIADQRLNQ